MSDINFLKSFLTEDLYILKNEKLTTDTSDVAINKENSYQEVDKIVVENVQEPEIKPFPSHKGAFKKKILIAVDYNNQEFIDESDLQFLLKILGAVSLQLDDVAVVNINKTPFDLTDAKDWSIGNLLIFSSKNNLDSSLELYKENQSSNMTSLWCNSLDEIAQDKTKKQLLWSALQRLFLN